MSKAFFFRSSFLLLVGIIIFHSCAKDRGSLPLPPFNLQKVEGFDGNPNLPYGWSLWNPNGDAAWQIVTNVGHNSNSCIGFNNCNGDTSFDMTGRLDRIMTPSYDFSRAISASISFDVAYSVLNLKGIEYTDSLAVYYSTDGAVWNRIYLEGGTSLASNLTGVTSSTPCWAPTLTTDWRTDKISLNNLAGKGNVTFAFENRSAWGQWIYLDNITVTASNKAPCNAKFAADVLPIMQTQCALGGCHDAASGRTDLSGYAGAKSIVDNGNMKNRVMNGNPSFMPASGKLPDASINAIQCWMDNGALNN